MVSIKHQIDKRVKTLINKIKKGNIYTSVRYNILFTNTIHIYAHCIQPVMKSKHALTKQSFQRKM